MLGVLTGCSVDFDVIAPAAAGVSATSTAGAVLVSGIGGSTRASSTAGAVTVLRARARDVRASSTAGDVRVESDAAPARVEATTTAGSVTVVVPGGPYRVDASAGAGSVTLQGITDTPSATSVIIADATAGDVTIRAR